MITVRPTPDVTAMAASDMATRGSESGDKTIEKKAISPEAPSTSLLIWSMDQWLEKRTKEVEMIDSFLRRGFDWPLQQQLRPKTKKQRKKIARWLEDNKERVEEARKEIHAKGGWQYSNESDYKPSKEQKEEWKQWLQRITGDMSNQDDYERSQTIVRGLIKKILRGIDCQIAKRFIPKDHWVYITMRYWLEEKREENDQWAEAMRVNVGYEKQRDVTMKETDEILEERYNMQIEREEKTPIRPSDEENRQKSEEKGQSEGYEPIGHQSIMLETIPEEPSPAERVVIKGDIYRSKQKQLLQKGDVNGHPSQNGVTKCQSTQNGATANQPSTQRATANQASIFRATESHTAQDECHTVPINTVAYEMAAKPTEEYAANQPTAITPKLIDPLDFTRRHAHYPVTFEDALLNGQYECRDTDSPIKHFIDWKTLIHKDKWTCNITQEIMENRAMSLDDWELEVWANAIDEELKLTCIDEDSEEWDVTDKQLARITHHIRSATEWFQQQPMQIRLHRLNTKGWLAERVYLYVQGRVTWPWQMGPTPTDDIERRLIELWHSSNRKKIHTPPSAIHDYTAWWREAKKQEYSQQQLRAGNQLTAKAEKLAHSLGKLPSGSHAEQEVLHYVTKGTAWPTSHLLEPPHSQLQQEVVTSWWANHRERLDRKWGPRYRSHDQSNAQTLWHHCTMAADASRIASTQSRSKATQQPKPKQRHKQTPWKDIPHDRPLPCQAQ